QLWTRFLRCVVRRFGHRSAGLERRIRHVARLGLCDRLRNSPGRRLDLRHRPPRLLGNLTREQPTAHDEITVVLPFGTGIYALGAMAVDQRLAGCSTTAEAGAARRREQSGQAESAI